MSGTERVKCEYIIASKISILYGGYKCTQYADIVATCRFLRLTYLTTHLWCWLSAKSTIFTSLSCAYLEYVPPKRKTLQQKLRDIDMTVDAADSKQMGFQLAHGDGPIHPLSSRHQIQTIKQRDTSHILASQNCISWLRSRI